MNGNVSAWIDDKLTLKYILNGTELHDNMPEYYYQIDSPTRILILSDCPYKQEEATIDNIIRLLEEKGLLAFKKIKASLGIGFIKAEYKKESSQYFLNGERYTKEQLRDELNQLKDYLVMELLEPHPQFAKFSEKSIGNLRYIIGRRLSGEPVEILSYMRLGTEKSGSVENYNAGGILTYVRDGHYKGGHIIDSETMTDVRIQHHPDNNEPICGEIPDWDKIKRVANKVADLLPQLSYMGIDFAVTKQNQIKILEINSLSSLDAIQLEESLYDMPSAAFFEERLKAIQ